MLKKFFPPWVIGAEMVMRTYEAKKSMDFLLNIICILKIWIFARKYNIFYIKNYFSANYSLIHLGGMSEQQNNNYNKQKKLLR